MKRGQLLSAGIFIAITLGVTTSAPPAAVAQTRAKSGTVSGVVRDASGIPQLGATVEIASEVPGNLFDHQFLTNTQGAFHAENLAPGYYSIRVTLAGYLPGLEKHIQISSNLTTVVRVELESLYASIEQLRHVPPTVAVEPDDWKWVLRSASGLRPILQWHEEDTDSSTAIVGESGAGRSSSGRVELTSGARRPGSISNIDGAPATAFAYDQRIDGSNHLIFAGQVSYDEDTPGGGLAAIWLPSASDENGPRSTVMMRESKIGPEGVIFHGVRLDQSNAMAFGDRFLLKVGAEYVLVGAGESAWNLRPRVKWETKLSPNWYVDAIYAALPTSAGVDGTPAELNASNPTSSLGSALDQLDSLPTLMWRHGRPVLENGRHEELAVEHKIGSQGALQIAAFHDDDSHVALFGRGQGMPALDYFQDFYSKGFAYDGGSSVSWGTRAALRERLTDDLELTAIYAFSGALVPVTVPVGGLRDSLRTVPRESATMKLTGKLPGTHTKLTAGYKWISGEALSRVDPYGEGLYDVSPYLHVGIRQPLPWIALGHLEANADCDNLLAQGYVPVTTRDGQMLLVPSFRSFRGGLSLQF